MRVTIVMGSSSDAKVMKGATEALDACGVEWDARILSAHRVPDELKAYIEQQEAAGTGVFIAGAGLAAHLPGVIASHTVKPVIGVPIRAAFDGLDALLSIVQMPKGVPVATVGVNNSYNAGLLAVQMLAAGASVRAGAGTKLEGGGQADGGQFGRSQADRSKAGREQAGGSTVGAGSAGPASGAEGLEEKVRQLRQERAAALLKEPQNREVFE